MQRYRAVIVIFLLGIVPVVAAFFFALWFLEDDAVASGAVDPLPAVAEAPAAPARPSPETQTVLAAARELPVGTLLGDEDLVAVEIELAAVQNEHVQVGEGPEAEVLRGFAVKEAHSAGEIIAWPAVVGPNRRGFLAAVLRPGLRAVTIRVDAATSHAGLVDPGDRVDVILSAEVVSADQERMVVARTIVDDVRVLAVDRRVGDLVAASGGGPRVERNEIVTATLEVTPGEGDRLVLGGHEGVLSLAVRSLAVSPPRVSDPAVDLRELLLSEETDSVRLLKERLQAEITTLEERLREEEEERARLETEGRIRLEEELARMEERLRADMEASSAEQVEEPANVRTVRVFRGITPAEDVEFSKER